MLEQVEDVTMPSLYQQQEPADAVEDGRPARNSPSQSENGVGAGARLGYTALVVFAVVATVQVSIYRSAPKTATTTMEVLDTTSPTTLSMSVSNVYTELYGAIGEAYPWVEFPVVDAFRPATLTASDTSDPGSLAADVTYMWTVSSTDSTKEAISAEGTEVTVLLDSVDDWTVELERVENGVVTDSYSSGIHARYVRRELRTLTEDDLKRFFSAMDVMFSPSVTLEVGQATYGENYLPADWFASLHNNMAGTRDCDHFHDGLGFLAWHAALTARFEASLQAIDNSIAMPFWDYTIDGEAINTLIADGMDEHSASVQGFQSSPIFSDAWFGAPWPVDGALTGRYAGLKIATSGEVSGIANNVQSPYGLVRAPWNMNNDPLVSRYFGVNGYYRSDTVSCTTHYALMSYTKFKDIGMQMQYDPHGLIHIQIGGSSNADFFTPLVEVLNMNGTSAGQFVAKSFAYLKNMWRMGYMSCPDSCDDDTESCSCTCSTDSNGVYAATGSHTSMFSDRDGNPIDAQIIDVLCDRLDGYDSGHPFVGDLLESGSPADPLFWVIHPGIERLFQVWALNFEQELDWPNKNSISVKTGSVEECSGHRANDTMSIPGLFVSGEYNDGDISLYDYTLKVRSSNADDLPYVYQNFRWEHCADVDGVPVDFSQ